MEMTFAEILDKILELGKKRNEHYNKHGFVKEYQEELTKEQQRLTDMLSDALGGMV